MRDRKQWEQHPNFPAQAAMHLQVHDRFRRALDALMEPHPGRRHLFRRLRSVLHHHHHAEEVGLFPMIRAYTGHELTDLLDDHGELEELLDRAADAFAPDALRELRERMLEHLEREESIVIPHLLELDPGLRRR